MLRSNLEINFLLHLIVFYCIWRVWIYQRCNQNPYIEEEQTTQWPKEKVQKDKQRSTKHTHKTKDWVTRTPLKTGGELRCSGRVSSSCSTNGTSRVDLIANPVITHAWGKVRTSWWLLGYTQNHNFHANISILPICLLIIN